MKSSLFFIAAVSAQLISGKKYDGDDPAQSKRGLRAGRGPVNDIYMGERHSAATADAEKEHELVRAKAEKHFFGKSSKSKAAKSEEGHSDDGEVSGKSAKAHVQHSADVSVKGTDASAHSASAHSESSDGKSKVKSKVTNSKSKKSGKSTKPDPLLGTIPSAATAKTSHSATAKSHKGQHDHSMGKAKSSKATHSASALSASVTPRSVD